MWLTSILGRSSRSRSAARERIAKYCQPRSFRPRIESLESRQLLTAGQPGTLDYTFNGSGIATTDIGSSTDRVADVAQQPDGKLVVAGTAKFSNGQEQFALVRYNTNGTRDSAFGNGGVVATSVGNGLSASLAAVAIQMDGKIVVAGTAIATNQKTSDSQLVLARYLSTGALDKTFGKNGIAVVNPTTGRDEVHDLVLQSDGKIVAVGTTPGKSTGVDFLIARFDATGALDKTFGGFGPVVGQNVIQGLVQTDFFAQADSADAVVIQPDGRILVAGSAFKLSFNTTESVMARYEPNGRLDVSFGSSGKLQEPSAWSGFDDVLVQPVAGSFRIVATSDSGLAAYTPAGLLDESFGYGGFSYSYDHASLALQADGSIVILSDVYTEGLQHDFVIARVTNEGLLDESFGSGGQATVNFYNAALGIFSGDDRAAAVLVQQDGKIVAVGTTSGQLDDFAIARLDGGALAASSQATTDVALMLFLDADDTTIQSRRKKLTSIADPNG